MSKSSVVVALAASAAILTTADRGIGAGSEVPALSAASAPQFAESAADRMPLAEFKRLFDQGAVVVVDVRGFASFRDGHIPGALSVPLDTVGRRAAEWKGETKPVVAYCS
jgi:3-mercaptopyruvate sulfurtransferase SseA